MQLLYWPKWQKLRLQSTTEYEPHGGFRTPRGTNSIVDALELYVADRKSIVDEASKLRWSTDNTQAVRLYRVHNYLTATMNGLANNKGLVHLAKVKVWIADNKDKLDLHTVHQANLQWDWDQVAIELRKMLIEDNMWFQNIYKDMKERVVEKNKTAEEMRKFIDLMREVNGRYKNDTW